MWREIYVKLTTHQGINESSSVSRDIPKAPVANTTPPKTSAEGQVTRRKPPSNKRVKSHMLLTALMLCLGFNLAMVDFLNQIQPGGRCILSPSTQYGHHCFPRVTNWLDIILI